MFANSGHYYSKHQQIISGTYTLEIAALLTLPPTFKFIL